MALKQFIVLYSGARSTEAFFAEVKPQAQHSFAATSSEREPEAEVDWRHSQPNAQAAISQKDILAILSGKYPAVPQPTIKIRIHLALRKSVPY